MWMGDDGMFSFKSMFRPDWDCSSVVERLPGIFEALGIIPSIAKLKTKKYIQYYYFDKWGN